MNIKSVAIGSFANLLLGSDIFARIKAVVTRQMDSGMSGEAKRMAALQEIKTIGLDLASWAVNLGIELAVAWLKTRAAKP